MTHGTPGSRWPYHQSDWRQQREPSYLHDPSPEPPLTEPGWGAAPALLGALLTALSLFSLNWIGEMGFADISRLVKQGITEQNYLSDANLLVRLYMPQGAAYASLLAAVIPAQWALGAIRWRDTIKWGPTSQSLREGDVEPTRILYCVIVGLVLLYHVISLLALSASIGRHGHFGPGPWLLLVGAALSLLGAIIGPHVPE